MLQNSTKKIVRSQKNLILFTNIWGFSTFNGWQNWLVGKTVLVAKGDDKHVFNILPDYCNINIIIQPLNIFLFFP